MVIVSKVEDQEIKTILDLMNEFPSGPGPEKNVYSKPSDDDRWAKPGTMICSRSNYGYIEKDLFNLEIRTYKQCKAACAKALSSIGKCFENDNDSVGRVWSRICASTSKVQVSGGDGTYQVSTGYSIFSATPLGFIYAKNKDHAVKDANVLFSGLCGSEGKIRVLFYSYKGRDFASLKNCQLLAEISDNLSKKTKSLNSLREDIEKEQAVFERLCTITNVQNDSIN